MSPSPAQSKYEKIVVAYSGGLDTTTILPWLHEYYGTQDTQIDIIAVCIDVGQGVEETAGLEAKALASGASACHIVDVTDEFVSDYLWPLVQSGAVYEGQYLLGTAIARPLIAKTLVDIALKEGATAICHGATGKGNDQVRFELAVKALAPQLKIIAPWRIWDLQSREDEMAYLEAKGLPVPMKADNSYSRDQNLWHTSHEGLELEDPAQAPNYEKLLMRCVTPEQAPDQPAFLSITFEHGVPVALNGEKLDGVTLLKQLNSLGGIHGIGVIDMVENRLVGMKSRGVYETPGGTLLYAAHQALEHLCLDKQTQSYKAQIAQKYGELMYDGLWFSPLRAALQAFIVQTQQTVSGTVNLKLYKGNIIPQGVTSPHSLYIESLASFATGDLFNHHDASGFINLYGLPSYVQGSLQLTNNPVSSLTV